MDSAVQLVQAYLQVNGYLTVTEYPVIETYGGASRSLSDLDILAFRFPRAAAELRRGRRRVLRGDALFETDRALAIPEGQTDMIVGEVKRGQARFNLATRDAEVLAVALLRFGCCAEDNAMSVARQLIEHGSAGTPSGHSIRMVAFGDQEGNRTSHWHAVTLDRVTRFLNEHLDAHWDVLKMVSFSNPAMDLLSILRRADRSGAGAEPESHG